MTFYEKITHLRKKQGWSQEELAEKLGVTRQSVSKWEMGQSQPDIDKILQMSSIFGVTTDYLLKDIPEPEYSETAEAQKDEQQPELKSSVRKLNISEAEGYLALRRKNAPKMGLFTVLCILSPVLMIWLAGRAEYDSVLPENTAGGIGLLVLIFMVAAAVGGFIYCSMSESEYKYLENEAFNLEADALESIKEKEKIYRSKYILYTVLGVTLCVLSLAPMFISMCITEEGSVEQELALISSVCGLFLIVAAGCFFLVMSGTVWRAFERLLQKEDFSVEKKSVNSKTEIFSSIYWSAVTLIYLCYSFKTMGWMYSWLIFVIGGILWGIVEAVIRLVEKK